MNIKIKIFLTLPIIFSSFCFAQTEQVKWGKADYSYEMPALNDTNDYSVNTDNLGRAVLKSIADAYWFFISDVDGDNCSFSPTCSRFFMMSVKKTNIFQGTLMFFDRFTRDMDIYQKYDHYPRVRDGHFYDPPSLYELDPEKINYVPPTAVVSK